MSNDSKHNPLLVKKSDAKKADLWHDMANQRSHKQHPHDIQPGDRHAVQKYENPTLATPLSEEETQSAVSSLEEQIKALKEQPHTQHTQQKPEPQTNSLANDDDWYD